MRVLITGGLGCVGSQIAREYLDAGHSVVIIDACEEKRNFWVGEKLESRAQIYCSRMEHLSGDTWLIYFGDPPADRAPPTLLDILHSCDAVVHAAASTGIPHSAEHPDDDWVSNVDATRVLLDALREHPLPTVILSSVKPYRITDFCRKRSNHLDMDGEITLSSGEHLDQNSVVPEWWCKRLSGHEGRCKRITPLDECYLFPQFRGLRETDELAPDEPYAASKAAQSMLAVAWARSYDLPVVTLRCSNLYGPAPCHGPRHGWLTWFCISAAIGRPLYVQGGGEQARDMLFGSDVFRACEAALSNARTLQGRIFNIGGGRDRIISVRAAAEWLRERFGCTTVEAPGRRHEDQLVFVDHSAFTNATGWKPLVGVHAGMADTYGWAREHADELRSVYEGV